MGEETVDQKCEAPTMAPGVMPHKPSVGRVVHFVPPQECTAEKTLAFYAAIITQVNSDGSVELATFGPNSLYFQHGILASETGAPTPGRWNWPPLV